MDLSIEIRGKFDEAASCDRILTSPNHSDLRYRHTRRYALSYDGDAIAVRAFASETLYDSIAQSWSEDQAPAFPNCQALIEVGVKKGVLDLEKEAIVNYYKTLPQPGFTLSGLQIFHRYYLFGGEGEINVDGIVKDLVNPAIQNHRLLTPADSASHV